MDAMGLRTMRSEVTEAKMEDASAWLDKAEAILSLPSEELVADVRIRDVGCFYLFLSIQRCIDLGACWIATAGWEIAEDAASAFEVLASHGVIDHDLAVGMRRAARIRDWIAHDYSTLDHAQVQSEIRGYAEALRKFLVLAASAAGL